MPNTIRASDRSSGGTSLRSPKNLSEEKWLAEGDKLCRADNKQKWKWGDWWARGEEYGYGERKAVAGEENWTGPPYKTLANRAVVARAFEPSRRREGLSFSLHQEVAKFSKEEADKRLDWCLEVVAERGRPRSIRECEHRSKDASAVAG